MAAKLKINFTKKNIEDLQPAESGKRLNIYDTQVRGLAVSITDRGAKSFVFRRKLNGRSERIFIGVFPETTVEMARGRAAEFITAIFKGQNPADQRRLDRQSMTFQQLFDEYVERHAKPHKTTWAEDVGKWNKYFASNSAGVNLAVRKLSSIERSDLATLHAKVGKTHPVTSNHLLILASSIFSKAKLWGLWTGENPVKGIPRYKQQSRDRFIQPDEMGRFFTALKQETNSTMRDFFLMALLTGARRDNVETMRWADLTLTEDRNEWRIPHTKSGKAQTVPLSKEAVKILLKRQKSADENDVYVFPADSKLGCIREPRKVWKRVCAAAGIKDLKIHDLRRSQGSYLAASGIPLLTISKALGHADTRVTEIYARLNLEPIRIAMETSSKAIFKAGRKRPKPVVVKFRKKAAGR